MKIGQTVCGRLYGIEYTIMKLIGQGGQGAVFLVDSPTHGIWVLKWYFSTQVSEDQYAALFNIIRSGPPSEEFVWPIDVVEQDRGFGYIMRLIDTNRFIEFGDMLSDISKAPTLRNRCKISYNLVRAYQKLHLRGQCYRDINEGNFMFDPKTGEIMICDNDNVGVEGSDHTQVLGTLEFMAPEVIQGNALPGIATDLYSLAILLFKFWVWHHPYHGMMEYTVKSWDLPAKQWLYGRNPIFIFDPNNKDNHLPDTAEYASINMMWNILPQRAQDLFTRAFTRGVLNPTERVRESHWIDLFQYMIERIEPCRHDGAENFLEGRTGKCWHCGSPVESRGVLELTTDSGSHEILLNSKTTLYQLQLSEFDASDPLKVLSYSTVNPNNPAELGLCNQTDCDWIYQDNTGQKFRIPIGRNAPLRDKVEIQLAAGVKGRVHLW